MLEDGFVQRPTRDVENWPAHPIVESVVVLSRIEAYYLGISINWDKLMSILRGTPGVQLISLARKTAYREVRQLHVQDRCVALRSATEIPKARRIFEQL